MNNNTIRELTPEEKNVAAEKSAKYLEGQGYSSQALVFLQEGYYDGYKDALASQPDTTALTEKIRQLTQALQDNRQLIETFLESEGAISLHSAQIEILQKAEDNAIKALENL